MKLIYIVILGKSEPGKVGDNFHSPWSLRLWLGSQYEEEKINECVARHVSWIKDPRLPQGWAPRGKLFLEGNINSCHVKRLVLRKNSMSSNHPSSDYRTF